DTWCFRRWRRSCSWRSAATPWPESPPPSRASQRGSANLLLSGTDVLLGELTIEAAATIDADYAEGMNLAMNYWFIIAATFLLTVVGTLVSQFIVEPRLG